MQSYEKRPLVIRHRYIFSNLENIKKITYKGIKMLQAMEGHCKLFSKTIIFLKRVERVLTQEIFQGILKISRCDASDFAYYRR